MVVLSTLCRANRLFNIASKTSVLKLLTEKQQNAFKQAVRNMSGGEDRTFFITPSRFQYKKFKDDLHFYISLGVIPLSILIFYCNVFIGPATLTEIPEGYEPKHWEYYKHPIKRFIARNFYNDPQINHEQLLHGLQEEQDKINWGLACEKAKRLMLERNDYREYSFIPSDQGRHYRYFRKLVDELDESKGYK